MLNIKQWVLFVIKKCNIYISREPITSREKFAEGIENEIIKKSNGILHIGAHLGKEGRRYFTSGVPVLWVEEIPSVYEKLLRNIRTFPNQNAICALLGDQNDIYVQFNLASNNNASSSIFTFGDELGFDSLSMDSQISLRMKRLDSIYNLEDLVNYQHWVVDVQGAELLVLKGAGKLIQNCKSLLVEVSTRQVYRGGVLWKELASFLSDFDLMPLWQPGNQSHENIIFIKKPNYYKR